MARDPYQYFRVEAREILDQLGKGTLELDEGAAAPERIARMLRLAHTLKGAARVVKQREIANHAHEIEDALAPFRDQAGAVSRAGIDAMLQALDKIALRMGSLASQTQSNVASDSGAALRLSSVPIAPVEVMRTNVDEIDVLLEGVTEASVQLAALRRGFEPLQRALRLTQIVEEHVAAPRAERLASSPKLSATIAELRNLVVGIKRSVSDGFEQVGRELSQVREAAERLRLLPASFMFVSLERAAHDAGQSVGKRIVVATSGGDVRLDAQVFGPVQSALVQAVRNAVAHGIETEAERKAAGKPPEGQLWIEVRRSGHRAVFVCKDDGRGVDLDAVRGAVQRKGLSPADATDLSTEELLQVLLDGGISTSGAVTQIAGRGVGLDVVREAVSQLRGEVAIRTERGLGTTLEIVVPVSLSAIDALVVESGGRAVAIPLDAIKRTLRVGVDDLARSAQGASIVFEGRVIPFAPLERVFRRVAQATDGPRSWSAVVVEGANALAAVGVDRLCGTQNLILRQLPKFTPSDPVVAGASMDAEGHPQLVLDPDGLVQHVCRAEPTVAAAPLRRTPILVIDDSLTTRMLEQSILESAGYEVDLATSGEDGLEQARKRRYELFLVDVEMPGMDGFTFIERTQADSILREVPSVLVTSRAAPEDRRRGQSVGARGYIVKGEFDQSELLEKIRSLVGMR
jgi:two-component system, chemotaxis family, sensor kinase CheA